MELLKDEDIEKILGKRKCFVEEPSDIYYEEINTITDKSVINNNVVLELLLFSMFRRYKNILGIILGERINLYNKLDYMRKRSNKDPNITKLLNLYEYLANIKELKEWFTMDVYIFNEFVIMAGKDRSLLWHCSNLLNISKVYQLHTQIRKRILKTDSIIIETDENIARIIADENNTNFYKLYRSEDKQDIIRDIRGLYMTDMIPDTVAQIDECLNKFKIDNYSERDNIFAWNHYPNPQINSIFHLHIAIFNIFTRIDTRIEMMYRYIGNTGGKVLLWDKYKHYNMKNFMMTYDTADNEIEIGQHGTVRKSLYRKYGRTSLKKYISCE